jgi:2-oxoisovalerate dehydrogenase E1 component
MDTKKKIYFNALKIRAAEEQLLIGYKNRDFGGTVHTCIGQELLPAMLSELLGTNNFILSNHRGHGHYIAHTGDLKSLFREFLAKEGAPSKGIGGSQHLHNTNFLSNGIQGCTAPLAVGIGMVKPTIHYIGDGTFGEGALYEALNLAKLVSSHLLLVVEDNEISQSTPSKKVLMGAGIAERLRAFGFECIEVDSANPLAMFSEIEALISTWPNPNPIAIICKSYRLRSHSKGDDTRNSNYVINLPDPLKILASELRIDHEKEFRLTAEDVLSKWNEVKSEKDIIFFENRNKYEFEVDLPDYGSSEKRINNVIRDAISHALESGALFIGEDIITKWEPGSNAYGGAFGVSLGLSENFSKVIGTSISEAGLVGVAAGHALASKKLSIAEIMFADFSTLIIDQLHNGVDKYLKMFGARLSIPLVVRLPYGMGRGYGPTHSQAPFEIFSGLTEIVNISYTPFLNYESLLEKVQLAGVAAIINEPKVYYGDLMQDWFDLIEGGELIPINGVLTSSFIYSTSKIPAVKVISHGSAVKAVLQAIKKYSINCELIIVSELYSGFDFISQFSNVKTPLVIIEEKNSSYGALFTSIASDVLKSKNIAFVLSNSPVKNIPANSEWESDLMITCETVNKIVKEAML